MLFVYFLQQHFAQGNGHDSVTISQFCVTVLTMRQADLFKYWERIYRRCAVFPPPRVQHLVKVWTYIDDPNCTIFSSTTKCLNIAHTRIIRGVLLVSNTLWMCECAIFSTMTTTTATSTDNWLNFPEGNYCLTSLNRTMGRAGFYLEKER